MRRGHAWVAGVALVMAVVSAGLAWRFGPAVLLSLGLASSSLERWLAPLGREPKVQEVTLNAGERTLIADLYRPTAPRGALLLVHGLSRAGRRQADLTRLARLLGRQGQVVLVPHFEGLAAFRLSGGEIAEVGAALQHLRTLAGSIGIPSGVGLAGFSFGAGPALLAAAGVPGLRLVGAFGGYADLRHVITFITTGAHTFNGKRFQQRQEEYNRWKLLAILVGLVENPRDRGLPAMIAEHRLANPGRDTAPLESDLGAEGRLMWAIVTSRGEEESAALVAALPARARAALDALSPLAALPNLGGRLLIAHGAGDDSIPFTESLRLAAAAPAARLVVFRTFDHTGPLPLWRALGDQVLDCVDLVRLADHLLRAP